VALVKILDAKTDQFAMLKKLSNLSAAAFENLVYDTVTALGLENAVWRTPGRDSGRDIEGIFTVSDLSGYRHSQRWYIECKKYASSVDWPTIHGKLAYADAQAAEFLLLVTTATVSPQGIDEMNRWNSRHRYPKVRAWNGYQLVQILEQIPEVQLKYALGLNSPSKAAAALFPLANMTLKFTEASYNEAVFKQVATPSIEAAAALADLSTRRFLQVQDGENWGPEPLQKADYYEWLNIPNKGMQLPFDRYVFRALIAVFRCMAKSRSVKVEASGKSGMYLISDGERILSRGQQQDLQLISRWGNCEISFEKRNICIHERTL
jgi:hypothetical protein